MNQRYHFIKHDDSLRYTSMDEMGDEVLVITIDIGDGRKDDLTVREDDDPSVLAEEFCRKHRLGEDAKRALIVQIRQNLEMHTEEDDSTLISINKSYDSKPNRNSDLKKWSPSESDHRPVSTTRTKTPVDSSQANDSKDFSYSPLIRNYGEKLYFKGIRFIENVNKKKSDFLKERTEKEKQDTTFKPKINNNKVERKAVQDELLKKGREKQENIDKKRGEILAEELRSCTFSPLINRTNTAHNITDPSKTNIETNMNSASRYLKLYNSAKHTENKIKQSNEKL